MKVAPEVGRGHPEGVLAAVAVARRGRGAAEGVRGEGRGDRGVRARLRVPAAVKRGRDHVVSGEAGVDRLLARGLARRVRERGRGPRGRPAHRGRVALALEGAHVHEVVAHHGVELVAVAADPLVLVIAALGKGCFALRTLVDGLRVRLVRVDRGRRGWGAGRSHGRRARSESIIARLSALIRGVMGLHVVRSERGRGEKD